MEDAEIIKQILQEFDRKETLLRGFSEACERLTKQILSSENLRVHSVTSRVKERPKLEKIKREGKDYRDLGTITDVVGVRIITHFEDDVDQIGKVIEREFYIDKDNSIDKRKALDPDRFGYLSLHYISMIRADRCKLIEYKQYAGLVFEIQIRSILQHAWAEIEHDLGYKSGSAIPAPVRRQFSRLAGLLELADTEFSHIRDELSHYAERVQKDIFQNATEVTLDDVSLAAFISADVLVEKLDKEIAALAGLELETGRDTQKLAQELLYAGFETISQVRTALESKQKMVVEQLRQRIKGRESSLTRASRGISLFQLFQITIVEKSGSSGLRKAFEEFEIGSELHREEFVSEAIKVIGKML
jgi:putative GTP pyrophosphokinase